VGRRNCDKKAAVLLLASYGVDVDVIAKALCLKPSTVRAYLRRYGKRPPVGVEERRTGGGPVEQPAPAAAPQTQAPPLSNPWVQLLRSKRQ